MTIFFQKGNIKRNIFTSFYFLFFCIISNSTLAQYDSTNVTVNVFYEPVFDEEIAYDEADTLTDLMSVVESTTFLYSVSVEVEDTINIASVNVFLYDDTNSLLSSHNFMYDVDTNDSTYTFERIEYSLFLGMGEFPEYPSHSCDVEITDINGVTSPTIHYFIIEDEE